ncbi:MAG: DUF4870 domain-containing protein [Chloroflexi bacterium]|nr:MAG: DUF4870 domain-containing protein [Chloroflexota bacterium]
MTDETSLSPTSDERMMGALAHFFGVIAALIVWVTQKDKSRFVRFQAAQAMAFDFAVMLLMGVVFFCLFGAMFVGMFGTMAVTLNSSTSPENVSPFLMFPFMFPSLMFSCILPFSLAFLIARIVAAASVLSGNNFHYPFLGAKVEGFLAD